MPTKKKTESEPVKTLPSSVPPMQIETIEEEAPASPQPPKAENPPVVGVPPDLPPLESVNGPLPKLNTPTLDVSLERPIPKTKSSPRRPLLIILLFVLALGLAGTAIWMFTQSSSTTTITVTPSPTPLATVEPSPSPVPGLKREEITIEILNGTDTSGLAGKNATIFGDLGYKVENTGNAEDDATANMLFVKEDLESQLTLLLDDVDRELNISSISGYLDEDSEVMARIILGGE